MQVLTPFGEIVDQGQQLQFLLPSGAILDQELFGVSDAQAALTGSSLTMGQGTSGVTVSIGL